jgi:hypothetical protein
LRADVGHESTWRLGDGRRNERTLCQERNISQRAVSGQSFAMRKLATLREKRKAVSSGTNLQKGQEQRAGNRLHVRRIVIA